MRFFDHKYIVMTSLLLGLVIFVLMNNGDDHIKVDSSIKTIVDIPAINSVNLKESTHSSRLSKHSASRVSSEPNETTPVFKVDEKLKSSLLRFNELKKATLFKETMSKKAEKLFSYPMIMHFTGHIRKSYSETGFNSEDEKVRMAMIDYIGETALGNIDGEDQSLAQDLIHDLLAEDVSFGSMHKAMKQSVVGDKMDLMAYLTQMNKDDALDYLHLQKNSELIPHLKVGFKNGLYFKGVAISEIKKQERKVPSEI